MRWGLTPSRMRGLLFLSVLSCYAADPLTAESNLLRKNPPAYATKLQALRPNYQGTLFRRPKQVPIETNEGVRALDEAVKALKRQSPLSPLADSRELARAALEHVRDIGPKGLTSHEGSNGSTPSSRIRHYIRNPTAIAEVMSFGPKAPEDVIVELLIDDGVPGRGHRKILLDPSLQQAGSACGPHKIYGTVCVIDFSNVPSPDHARLTFVP